VVPLDEAFFSKPAASSKKARRIPEPENRSFHAQFEKSSQNLFHAIVAKPSPLMLIQN